MSAYDGLTREQLEARLSAAEDVCRMYAWSGGSPESDREKALYMLWRGWTDVADEGAMLRRNFPHLSDRAVAVLASERDAIRARTLEAIRADA